MNISGLSNLSRRHFISAGLGASALIVAPRRLFAEETGIVPTMIQAASQAKIEVNRLRRNIAVLEGFGGNIAVLTGKDGKLLIDAGFTVSRPPISPALDSLSADRITRLINTHWHVDHTDGNAWLHAEGAAIAAHENTKKHLSTSTPRVLRHASRHPRQCLKIQEARQIARRNDRGEADSRLRRQMGSVSYDPCDIHQARLLGSLVRD